MSVADIQLPPPPVEHAPPVVAVLEDRRGTFGMSLFILTEAWLFIMLFCAYFYLAQGTWRWLAKSPPKLSFAIPMLAILLTSSGVLRWGEKQLKAGQRGAARRAIGGTIFLGCVFLVLQSFEYMEHLKELTPRTDAYGSIFYTITTFHGAHVIVGLLMLIYVLMLPRLEPAPNLPHRPMHNAAMYWHFVDLVWVFIVALMYVAPNIR